VSLTQSMMSLVMASSSTPPTQTGSIPASRPAAPGMMTTTFEKSQASRHLCRGGRCSAFLFPCRRWKVPGMVAMTGVSTGKLLEQLLAGQTQTSELQLRVDSVVG
jgi:hypothetical protein